MRRRAIGRAPFSSLATGRAARSWFAPRTAGLSGIVRVVDAALEGQSWAIQQVADRIDGKPAQESTVNVKEKREASDWTREELMAILAKHVKRDDEAKATAPSTDSLN